MASYATKDWSFPAVVGAIRLLMCKDQRCCAVHCLSQEQMKVIAVEGGGSYPEVAIPIGWLRLVTPHMRTVSHLVHFREIWRCAVI